LQQPTVKTTAGPPILAIDAVVFYQQFEFPYYLRVIMSRKRFSPARRGGTLKYRGRAMRICLPPCAITNETGIVRRCITLTRPAVFMKRRSYIYMCVCVSHRFALCLSFHRGLFISISRR